MGWAIGRGEDYEDQDYQDQVEAAAIYQILEEEAVPLFYDRRPDGLPRGWIARMKSAMRSLCPVFNTHRMVPEYTERFYVPALARARQLAEDGASRAVDLAEWKAGIRQAWSRVKIARVESHGAPAFRVGDELEVRAHVVLGSLTTDDVVVELYHGQVDTRGQIARTESLPMDPVSAGDDGAHLYSVRLPCRVSGRRGYTVRVMPFHRDQVSSMESRLVIWA